ncbi:MAG: sigma-70 family RNA polymerase sigma factor [Lachnobacterium sp.]|nr:sigma-70 family RNA polymerase sigma factor [Lachnobacterium sp.]
MQRITQEELSALIMDNKDGMYRLAFSILRNDADAQDAVSEAIVLAFEKCHQLRKRSSAKSWLMQILVNSSKKIAVQSNKYVLLENEIQYEQAEEFKDDDMWETVMELDEEFRGVVVLYYYEQFSVREIGKMLRVPEGTVKSRLARAREKLLRIIG